MHIVSAALACLHRENASWLHFPYSGGIMEQPWRTMQAFRVVQMVVSAKIAEEMKRGQK